MDSNSTSGFPTTLLFTLIALILVLVLAWFAIRMLAQLSTGRSKGGRIEVLQNVPVGTGERLVLLKFDNREILIGVTAGGITVLDTVDEFDPSRHLDPAPGNTDKTFA